MSEVSTFEQQPASRSQWIFLHLVFWVLYFLLFSPLIAMLGLYVYFQTQRDPRFRFLVRVLSLVSLVGLLFFWPYELFLKYPETLLPETLFRSLPLIPLATVTIELARRVSVFLKPKSLSERIEEDKKELLKRERRQSQVAKKLEHSQSQNKAGLLSLGVYIKGDHFPKHTGVYHADRFIHLDQKALDEHFFVLGTTGAGKSETIKRLIYEVLTKTDRDIILVDGKGEEKLAYDIQRLCEQNGRGKSPIFKMGHAQKGDPYNGFVGQDEDIYNRLAAMVGVQEAEGGAAYYADMNRNILQLICSSPLGPPENFSEAIRRIRKAWLMEAWQDDRDELDNIEEIGDEHLSSLRNRMLAAARPLKGQVTEEGFVLEDSRSTIFSIRTQSVSDTAQRFLHFLIEDIKDFVGKRQKRPGLLVIDEFGMFGNSNIVALLSLARSANLGVVLATQDVSTLGDEDTKRMILANTNTTLLMLSKFPEEVAEMAGTTYQVESSFQHEEGETTGMGSARIQHAYKVDLNEARRQQPGEAFLIRHGYTAKLRVALVQE